MLKGSLWEIIQASITATIGVSAVSMAIIGTSYFGNIRWNIFQRILFFGAFIGLITPGTRTDLLGILVMSIGILTHPKIWQSSLNFLWNRKKKVIVGGK